MTQFDIAAVALLIAFAYGGYRRGLMVFVLHLTGGLLAFALAAALAPLLAPYVAEALRQPAVGARPAAVIGLTALLRLVFGFALRELALTLREVIRAIPVLRLLDRVLGVIPGLALGAAFVLLVAVAALTLPLGQSTRDAVAESWVGRNVVTQPEAAMTTLHRLWDELIVTPPRLQLLPLAMGVGGLWLGAVAAHQLRRTGGPAPSPMSDYDLGEAPTRRISRRAATAAQAADPLALARAVLGIGAAAAMILGLLLLTQMRGGF